MERIDFKLINEIINNGETYDTYKINNTIYYKVIYEKKNYIISENNGFYKIEESK